MKIVQRVPNCFTLGYEPMRTEVSTLEEFYTLPYIQSWMKDENFLRFSKARTHKHQALLVCEFKGKAPSYMAFLTEHDSFDLPIYQKNI